MLLKKKFIESTSDLISPNSSFSCCYARQWLWQASFAFQFLWKVVCHWMCC